MLLPMNKGECLCNASITIHVYINVSSNICPFVQKYYPIVLGSSFLNSKGILLVKGYSLHYFLHFLSALVFYLNKTRGSVLLYFSPFILVSLCLCLFAFLPARPHGEQRAPFIDQHKLPNKWAENESYARGSQAQPRLLRTPSILISILMKRLLLAGCP